MGRHARILLAIALFGVAVFIVSYLIAGSMK